MGIIHKFINHYKDPFQQPEGNKFRITGVFHVEQLQVLLLNDLGYYCRLDAGIVTLNLGFLSLLPTEKNGLWLLRV